MPILIYALKPTPLNRLGMQLLFKHIVHRSSLDHVMITLLTTAPAKTINIIGYLDSAKKGRILALVPKVPSQQASDNPNISNVTLTSLQ